MFKAAILESFENYSGNVSFQEIWLNTLKTLGNVVPAYHSSFYLLGTNGANELSLKDVRCVYLAFPCLNLNFKNVTYWLFFDYLYFINLFSQ